MGHSLGIWHKATHRAGDSNYYADHQRGTLEVHHDSKRYIYEQPPYSRKETKSAIRDAFSENGRVSVRITGRWPCYAADTFC